MEENAEPTMTDYKIATIGSHSALQILHGAKQEGFSTIAVCEKGREKPYQSYKVADEILTVKKLADFPGLQDELRKKNAILIPHGSFIGPMTTEQIEQFQVPYFGNRKILRWEFDRTMQRDWLHKAGLITPKIFKKPEDIDRSVIIKFFGAHGGKGFFLAKTPEEFYKKIREKEAHQYIIQEYIIGAPMYIHYFYSPITGELEVMSFDKRYESNVDSVGRIAAKDQLDLDLETSYNITGNVPVVVRESLLPHIFEMGEAVVKVSKKLEKHGMIGPFSLETVITPDLHFYVFEISARIVAGTNLYINGTPYTDLRYDVPMSTGRRIAREIRMAIEQKKLGKILL
jgi:5-formaminoimidazole-4-carboxamide-1-(beta)-D-ribofuranosyl 5'-monophosphate synthetase